MSSKTRSVDVECSFVDAGRGGSCRPSSEGECVTINEAPLRYRLRVAKHASFIQSRAGAKCNPAGLAHERGKPVLYEECLANSG